MKKTLLIFCSILLSFSLMAYGFMNWSDNTTTHTKKLCNKPIRLKNDFVNIVSDRAPLNLLYDVSSRFNYTVSKEKLQNAKSIVDIFPKEATDSIDSFELVYVTVMGEDKVVSIVGGGATLNPGQIELLQSVDYSTNINIKANYQDKTIPENWNYDHIIYYMTIVPEKEAVYGENKDELIDYLKENSKKETANINKEQLRPGRVNFTITKNGTVENVEIGSSSGYTSVDTTLLEVITNMPEKWEPATNSKGEKVDQDLVFFFGMKGC